MTGLAIGMRQISPARAGASMRFGAARALAATIAAGVALGVAPAAFAWPDAPLAAGVSIDSPSSSLAMVGIATSPALRLGPLAFTSFSEGTAQRRLSDSAAGHSVASAVRVALPWATGVWLGAGLERAAFSVRSGSPTFEVGARTGIANAAVSIRMRHRTLNVLQAPLLVTSWTSPPNFHAPPDTIPTVPYWEERDPWRIRATTVDGSLRWSRARWDVQADAGVTVGPRLVPIRSLRMQATRWMSPRWGVDLGAAGPAPRWLTGNLSDRPRAWLGLRLEAGRPAIPSIAAARGLARPAPRWRWSVRRIEDGVYVLRLRASHLERIALRGDFTGWEPVWMTRFDSWWETSLRMPPGPHQLEISLNGVDWLPPPGVPTTTGIYGDEVGIFVAE